MFEVAEDSPSHLRQFVCVAAIDLRGQFYRSAPRAALSKRDAERASALDLLSQLPANLTENRSPRDKPINMAPDKSPVSLLQEWTNQRAIPSRATS